MTAVSAKSKNPIVSFDSDKVTAKESPVPVAEVEPTTADVNTPERLAALVSGIYSASNGYRPTPAGNSPISVALAYGHHPWGGQGHMSLLLI